MAHNIEAILTIKDNATAALSMVDNSLRQFGNSLQSKGKALKNFGSSLGYIGKDMMKLNAPFIALGGWATKLGIEFDAVTSETQAIMNVSKKAMDPFVEKAKEVGEATSKSAKESMEAMKLLAQSGMEQTDVLETVYPLVRLSEAGNLDMAHAADLLTNSMKSANIELENTSQYLDQVALVGNLASTDIEQQMEAWLKAGGSIDSANMQMHEANALLGVMANRGVKGSEAGNTLSRVFQNLNATSGEAGKAMEKLRIQTADSDGVMRNKIDVLKELKEKTDVMTESQREQYLTMIGGKAHTENLKKILAGLGDEYDSLAFQLIEADGALEKMAITMKDNLKGQLETLSSKSETFGLKLKDVLLPYVKNVVEGLTQFVDKLNTMDESHLDSIVQTIITTTKVAASLIFMGSGIRLVGQFMDNFGKTIWHVSKFLKYFEIGVIKAGLVLGGLVLIIATVIKHWDKIKEGALEAKDAIKSFIDENVDMDLIKEKLLLIWLHISVIKMNFGLLAEKVWEVAKKIGSIVLKLAQIIGESFLNNIPDAISGFFIAFEGLAEFLSGVIGLIRGILIDDSERITRNLGMIWNGGINFIKGLWQGLISLLSVPIEAAVKLLEGKFPRVAQTIETIWGGLKKFLKNPIKTTAELLDKLSDKVQPIKEKWEELKEFVKHPIKGTINLVQKGFDWAKGKIGQNWQGTPYWTGGPTFLHEKGGEIFDLPDGTRVYPHDKSVQMAREEGRNESNRGKPTFVLDKLADKIIVREEADIYKIADALAAKLEGADFNMA